LSSLIIAGNTSGTITLDAPAVAGTTTLTLPTTSGTIVTTNTMPAGSVLQVVQTVKTDKFTTTSGTFVDITGYSATITPSSTSSKILVISSFHVSGGTNGSYPRTQLLRGATALGLGDASGSATQITATSSNTNSAAPDIFNVAYSYLDSPSTTSATTYKWQLAGFSSRTGTFNGSDGTSGSNFYNSSSTIILMEIKG
jgi:hypothetical protein